MTTGNPTDRETRLHCNDDPPLTDWIDQQYRLSAAAMLQSISAIHLVKERPAFGQIIRPARGSVLASPVMASYDPYPDYFFHWFRDSAIVIDAARILIEDGTYGSKVVDHVKDFVRFSLRLRDLDGRLLLTSPSISSAVDPEFRRYVRSEAELSDAFGEAIFVETRVNPDGTLDFIKWARPQLDGPALRALVTMRFWQRYFFNDAEMCKAARELVEADLAFTYRHWAEPSFDIWEEELGHHYYTRLVQYAALADGAKWLDERGQFGQAQAYMAASHEISQHLDRYWVAARGFYISRIEVMAGIPGKELDIATILAVNHAGREKGPHSVLDPRAQATLAKLEKLFAAEYEINGSLPCDRGVAMGRYAGDRYYSGGAYYFATLAAAEFLYQLARAVANRPTGDDTINEYALPMNILADADQALDQSGVIAALLSRGDGFMSTVRAYTPASGDLSEQFDRISGRQTSSQNLAWSHAAFITAVASRRAALRAVEGEALHRQILP
jgi:glucoamylase